MYTRVGRDDGLDFAKKLLGYPNSIDSLGIIKSISEHDYFVAISSTCLCVKSFVTYYLD